MKPANQMDQVIGNYIAKYQEQDFSKILLEDERLEAATYLSELPNGLVGWYPFNPEGTILQIGSWFGAFSGMLCSRCRRITVVEKDPYRARMTKVRLGELAKIEVEEAELPDFCQKCKAVYDYILIVVDENHDDIPDKKVYVEMLRAAKSLLSAEGKILLAVPNRFGTKYFCGEPDPNTKTRFDGITDNDTGLYRPSRAELLELIDATGFRYKKLYYPMPDHRRTRVIYTEGCRPGRDMLERLDVYVDDKLGRVLDEPVLMDHLAQNDVITFFSNAFLIEAGNTSCSHVVYSAVSAERERDKAFATNIYDNGIVCKIPLYPEGKAGIDRLFANTRELAERGVPVLEMKKENGMAVMRQVQKPSLSQYLRDVVGKDADSFIRAIDKLRGYILESSEHVSAEKNSMRHWAPEIFWGVILKKAFIEMIPVNCFYNNESFLFYDQEFTKENCPADYVLYRALRDMYGFAPEIEEFVPLGNLKQRYGMYSTWEYYEQEERQFQTELRRRNLFSGFNQWVWYYGNVMKENRRNLDMEKDCMEGGYFDPFYNLDGRRVILFGSGKIAEYYLDKYGSLYAPFFIVDNDWDKWGGKKEGIEIKPPDSLAQLMYGTYRVIIAIKDYEAIVEQLERMGIRADSYRIFSTEMEPLLGGKMSDTMSGGKYNIGYVTGVFDLFHIGHLNLFKNCKKHCHYLVAGVLTDELTKQDKAKTPFIPFEERMEIVKQCRYVDRVVAVDFHNTNKIEAWKELRYGCLFSGNDHEGQPYWTWLQRKLRTLGSELEFFPYTKSTSSTMLQAEITGAVEAKESDAGE